MIKKYLLLLIFVLALALRAGVLYNTHHEYFLTGLTYESGVMAYSLLHGKGYATTDISLFIQNKGEKLVDVSEYSDELIKANYYYSAHETPGYATLLAATWKIFGEEKYIYIQIIQIIFDSLLVFLIFWIATKVGCTKTQALIAALLYALFTPAARMAAAPLRDIWATFTVFLTVAALVKAMEYNKHRHRLMTYAAIGLILGLGIYVHSIVQYLGIFFAFGVFIKRGIRETISYLLISYTIIIISLSPWIIRNYRLFNAFIPTRDVIWQGVWEGWGEFPDNPMGAVMNDSITYEQIAAEGFTGRYGSREYNEILRKKSFQAIKQYPLWIIGAMIRRIPSVISPKIAFINDSYSPDFIDEYNLFKAKLSAQKLIGLMSAHPFSFIKKAFTIINFFFHVGIIGLTIMGIIISSRKLRDFIFVMIIPVYYFAILIPLHVEARYLLPIFPAYFIFAGIALHRLEKLPWKWYKILSK